MKCSRPEVIVVRFVVSSRHVSSRFVFMVVRYTNLLFFSFSLALSLLNSTLEIEAE